MQLASSTDYRELLREELATRCQINPRYSLRAFARDLGLAPSRLSEILNRKQGLSRVAAEKVSSKLGLSADQAELFCDLVESCHSRSEKRRAEARLKLNQHLTNDTAGEVLKVKNETFHLISDWYHLVILELIKTANFRSDPVWLANRIGISHAEVMVALSRLERFGFIEWRDNPRRLVTVEKHSHMQGGPPSDAVKKFHHQVLDKAIGALLMQPVDRRDVASVVLSVDSKRLPEARKMISDFWRHFCTTMDASPAELKDDVYCLSVQYFSLIGNPLPKASV